MQLLKDVAKFVHQCHDLGSEVVCKKSIPVSHLASPLSNHANLPSPRTQGSEELDIGDEAILEYVTSTYFVPCAPCA